MARKVINNMNAERKRGFIYTGGEVYTENITDKPEKDDFCIAADSGYKTARALGVKIDVVIGDFDSLGSVSIPDGIERIELPCEKDCTDTQAAVQVALEGSDYTVLRWQVISTAYWEAEDKLPVWGAS